jgi:hypothetical protein
MRDATDSPESTKPVDANATAGATVTRRVFGWSAFRDERKRTINSLLIENRELTALRQVRPYGRAPKTAAIGKARVA